MMDDRTTIQISAKLRKELRILASKRDVSYQEILKDMINIFKELDREKTIISIPNKLSKRIESKIKDTDINSVSEYITFLLRLTLSEYQDKTTISEKEGEILKKKLKSLGYL